MVAHAGSLHSPGDGRVERLNLFPTFRDAQVFTRSVGQTPSQIVRVEIREVKRKGAGRKK